MDSAVHRDAVSLQQTMIKLLLQAQFFHKKKPTPRQHLPPMCMTQHTFHLWRHESKWYMNQSRVKRKNSILQKPCTDIHAPPNISFTRRRTVARIRPDIVRMHSARILCLVVVVTVRVEQIGNIFLSPPPLFHSFIRLGQILFELRLVCVKWADTRLRRIVSTKQIQNRIKWNVIRFIVTCKHRVITQPTQILFAGSSDGA